MSLQDIKIDSEYRTLSCDMANDFYIPMLGEAILYKRAVGFFSSSALASISAGIYELYENGGKIQLIASPKLSPEDIEAINDGYQQREEIIKGALKRELEEEIGIHILNAELYERFQFEYPTKILDFSFYLVTEWIGEPFGREGQEGFWLEQSELDAGQFPPANLKLIQRLVTESVK